MHTQLLHSKDKRSKLGLWEDKFFPKLKLLHGNHAKKVFHRLMKKSVTLKSSLKRRSKEYEVKCILTVDEVRALFFQHYGQPCRYCKKVLDVSNIVCDHIYPISMGGTSLFLIHINCEIILDLPDTITKNSICNSSDESKPYLFLKIL